MKLYVREPAGERYADLKEQHDAAWGLLFEVLEENASWISRDDFGKPYLKEHPEICFNISHCDRLVAVLISDHPVGVDVQPLFEWRERLAKKITSADEWEDLSALTDPEERGRALSVLWTRKESYLKCVGIGLRRNLREVPVGIWTCEDHRIPDSIYCGSEIGIIDAEQMSGGLLETQDGTFLIKSVILGETAISFCRKT